MRTIEITQQIATAQFNEDQWKYKEAREYLERAKEMVDVILSWKEYTEDKNQLNLDLKQK